LLFALGVFHDLYLIQADFLNLRQHFSGMLSERAGPEPNWYFCDGARRQNRNCFN